MRGRFTLFSDMSKFTTGSLLYQIQDGQPKRIAYTSKKMPEAAKNYSISELETCGLAINVATFAHLLKRVDFDAVVDHLAIMHILKNKKELVTTRIKRLLELLSSHSFNLYYIKGKDMVLSNFLSRQRHDKSDPHKIIPISFSLRDVLHNSYYKMEDDTGNDKYLVHTQAQVKAKDRWCQQYMAQQRY